MVETEREMPTTGSTSALELPDWAHLPELALHLISTKVKSVTDYVRFRAVCSSWRSASAPKPSHLPPQLPWLMINYSRIKKKGFGLFYDLWESKMHKLHFSETTHMACLASYHGWLLLTASGGQEVLLLNPLTRARIQLPPFNTGFQRHAVSHVTFSTDLTDPNCLIMVLYHRERMFHFCRVGDPCWTDVVGSKGGFAYIYDATYYNGRFYLLCHEGYMEIVESKKPEERIFHYFIELKLKYGVKFFLQGKSGIYLTVFCHNKYGDELDSAANDTKKGTMKILKWKIELYQVQFQEYSLQLKQITDTNDVAIFSDLNDFYLAVCSDWDLADYVGGNFINVRRSLDESRYLICSTKLDNGKSEVVYDLDAERHIKSLTWFHPSFV